MCNECGLGSIWEALHCICSQDIAMSSYGLSMLWFGMAMGLGARKLLELPRIVRRCVFNRSTKLHTQQVRSHSCVCNLALHQVRLVP